MMYRTLFLCILMIILLSACLVPQSEPSSTTQSSTKPSTLAKINVVSAKSLIIAPSNSGAGPDSRAVVPKLYKVTTDASGDDTLEAVTFLNESDQAFTLNMTPSAIYNVNNTYVILVFYNASYQFSGYLVRKSDGAVYTLANVGYPAGNQGYLTNRKSVFVDASNDIYFLNNAKVIKIDMQDPVNPTAQNYSPDTDNVNSFIMDSKGNILYNGQDASYQEISRIKKANGGLRNLGSHEGRAAWIGLDNKFYYFSDTTLDQITQVTIDTSFNVTTANYGSKIGFNNAITNLEAILLTVTGQSKIFIASKQNEVYEVYNNPRLVQGNTGKELGLNSIKLAKVSDNYYYLAGNNTSNNPVLLKVNPSNDSTTPLYTAGDYDIYKMAVSADDEITFNALRMSDSAKVIGKISAAGELTIIDEALNVEVTALERIN